MKSPSVFTIQTYAYIRVLAHAIIEDDKEKAKQVLVDLDKHEASEKRRLLIFVIVIALIFIAYKFF